MATNIERTYIVPLRKRTELAPEYKRAKKCVKVLIDFIAKHMKCKDVKIGKYLNEYIWKDGIKNFPHHVEVKAIKQTVKEDNKEITFVTVELLTLPKEHKKLEEKQKKLQQEAEKKKRKVSDKKDEEETDEQKEEKAVSDAISKNEAPTRKVVRKKVQKEEDKKEE